MKTKAYLREFLQNGTARKEKFPNFDTPMLATLTKDYFDDPEWIYERKLDGIRGLVYKKEKNVRLLSRNEQDLGATFPEIREAASALSEEDFIADGELVTFDKRVSSFSRLQDRLPIRDNPSEAVTSPKVYLYIFDLLFYHDVSVEKVPLLGRKSLLRKGFTRSDPFRLTAYRREAGKKFLQEACQKGWEGLIAKNENSTYTHGRSRQWLKFKCTNGQELVIGGFSEPRGERIGFGALLVGYYSHGKLQYAGKVGTGFDDEFLGKWREKLDRIASSKSPFENFSNDRNGRYHWVQPKYVGEFSFMEWTDKNKLRHPSFLGIRYDKDPREVKKESADENS